MTAIRKVLLADPDLASVRALTRALRQKGCQVYSARDGARALELAVLRHPDLVLFDRRCPVLDARTFVDILRTNPGTDTIPVVVTASAEEADEAMRDGPGALLRKPYNLDEVLAHIDDLLARADRARNDAAESQEIEGALAQLALPDLLQTLALARRTGRVTLRRGNERGEVELAEGRPVDARAARGPGREGAVPAPGLGGGDVLLPARSAGHGERASAGARTSCSSRRRGRPTSAGDSSTALPEAGTRWAQAPGAALRAVPPLAREVLGRLETPRSTAELLDGVEAADLAVLQAVAMLHGEGLIVAGGRGRPTGAGAPAHGGGGPRGAGARAARAEHVAGPGGEGAPRGA